MVASVPGPSKSQESNGNPETNERDVDEIADEEEEEEHNNGYRQLPANGLFHLALASLILLVPLRRLLVVVFPVMVTLVVSNQFG